MQYYGVVAFTIGFLVGLCLTVTYHEHQTRDVYRIRLVYKERGDIPNKVIWGKKENIHTTSPTCVRSDNLFFLKIHKTGSTTMYGLLNRVAINHNLSIVPYDTRSVKSCLL